MSGVFVAHSHISKTRRDLITTEVELVKIGGLRKGISLRAEDYGAPS